LTPADSATRTSTWSSKVSTIPSQPIAGLFRFGLSGDGISASLRSGSHRLLVQLSDSAVNWFTQHEKFNTGPIPRAAGTEPIQKDLSAITNRCRGDAARRSPARRSTSSCASAFHLSVFRRSSRRRVLPVQPSALLSPYRRPPAAQQISAPRRPPAVP